MNIISAACVRFFLQIHQESWIPHDAQRRFFSRGRALLSNNSPPSATSFLTHTSSCIHIYTRFVKPNRPAHTPSRQRLRPPPFFPSTLFQTETHTPYINLHPPSSNPPTTQGHPMPHTFLSDREHDTGPLRPRPPPGLSKPPSSIHHISPPASITTPQRQPTQRKEKAKKRGRRIRPLPCRTVLA